MANETIRGVTESIGFDVYDGTVRIFKDYRRFSEDAALPAEQGYRFEFYVHVWPIHLSVLHERSSTLTTARTAPRSEAGNPGLGFPERSSYRAMARMRESEMGIPGLGGVFEDVPDPRPPPPDIPDSIVPFEITFFPPGGRKSFVLTNPRQSEIENWPSDTVASRLIVDTDDYRGWWAINIKNINLEALRVWIQLRARFATTELQTRDFPLSLVNQLSAVALLKTLPQISYHDGTLMVSIEKQLADLFGIQTIDLGAIVSTLVTKLPSFSPTAAKLMSYWRFKELLQERKDRLLQLVADEMGGPTPSWKKTSLPPKRGRLTIYTTSASIPLKMNFKIDPITGIGCAWLSKDYLLT